MVAVFMLFIRSSSTPDLCNHLFVDLLSALGHYHVETEKGLHQIAGAKLEAQYCLKYHMLQH